MKKIEIHFEDGTVETCNIVKKYGNGDYQLDRKKRKRLELVSAYDHDYINYKYRNEKFIFVDAYLKDSKGYDQVLVRRIDE